MADFFFDTSAVSKRYHSEVGTARVDALLGASGSVHAISRLTVVELHSVFAKKVRTNQLSQANFERLIRRFRQDVHARMLRVVQLQGAHYRAATELVRRLGPAHNLRTLDALQLAVALGLNDPGRRVTFVCADVALGTVATAEGLAVINPELP